MDFFKRQEDARRSSRYLVVLFTLAVAGIVLALNVVAALVAHGATDAARGSPVLNWWITEQAMAAAGVSLAALALIGLASLYRMASLRGGGASVARALGGSPVSPDTRDLAERRLRNVVEEMAIASSLPVPEIYVLRQEQGINAFAAGYTPADAAIAVTRGALEQLDRDELQGVVAHEFSHILNGDMRLNQRLVGLLFGILVIGLLGRLVLRLRHGGRIRIDAAAKDRGAAIVLLVGLALMVIGYVGVFFGRLIKAGVSRQREYLADASAVQFTRQRDGIAGALKKIAGAATGSAMRAADPEEVSHMLFASGGRFWTAWVATHPPLEKRIQALDPAYRPDRAGAAAVAPGPGRDGAPGLASAGGGAAGSVTDLVGEPGNAQFRYAAQLVHRLPETLLEDLRSDLAAPRAVLALFLHRDGARRGPQFSILQSRLGTLAMQQVQSSRRMLDQVGDADMLPVLELAFPALRRLPAETLHFHLELARELVESDNLVDDREFALLQVLTVHARDLGSPARRQHRHVPAGALRAATGRVFSQLALAGQARPGEAESSYRRALAMMFPGQREEALPAFHPTPQVPAQLSADLFLLDALPPAGKRTLLQAMARLAIQDEEVSSGEADLLRCYAASLHVPLPPLATPAASPLRPG